MVSELSKLANEVSIAQNIATTNVSSTPVENVTAPKRINVLEASSVNTEKVKKAPIHHIATDKNRVSIQRGDPWTPRFEKMFENAGISMQHDLNKVSVIGHKGPHPKEYHLGVWESLKDATRGKNGEAYAIAFKSQLANLAKEISTPGTRMNDLVTKKDSNQSRSSNRNISASREGGSSRLSKQQKDVMKVKY